MKPLITEKDLEILFKSHPGANTCIMHTNEFNDFLNKTKFRNGISDFVLHNIFEHKLGFYTKIYNKYIMHCERIIPGNTYFFICNNVSEITLELISQYDEVGYEKMRDFFRMHEALS